MFKIGFVQVSVVLNIYRIVDKVYPRVIYVIIVLAQCFDLAAVISNAANVIRADVIFTEEVYVVSASLHRTVVAAGQRSVPTRDIEHFRAVPT